MLGNVVCDSEVDSQLHAQKHGGSDAVSGGIGGIPQSASSSRCAGAFASQPHCKCLQVPASASKIHDIFFIHPLAAMGHSSRSCNCAEYYNTDCASKKSMGTAMEGAQSFQNTHWQGTSILRVAQHCCQCRRQYGSGTRCITLPCRTEERTRDKGVLCRISIQDGDHAFRHPALQRHHKERDSIRCVQRGHSSQERPVQLCTRYASVKVIHALAHSTL
jgi:hypothetical protein